MKIAEELQALKQLPEQDNDKDLSDLQDPDPEPGYIQYIEEE